MDAALRCRSTEVGTDTSVKRLPSQLYASTMEHHIFFADSMLVLSIWKQLVGAMHLVSLRPQSRVPPYGQRTGAGRGGGASLWLEIA